MMEGAVAIVLLQGEVLKNLPTPSICTAIQFAFILLLAIFSLYLAAIKSNENI